MLTTNCKKVNLAVENDFSTGVVPSHFAEASQDVPQLIERIFTDQHGRQFRMVFMVAVVDGELKGKLVSVQPIATQYKIEDVRSKINTGEILCLPCAATKDGYSDSYILPFTSFISPYFSLEFLITSQPTRAPSK